MPEVAERVLNSPRGGTIPASKQGVLAVYQGPSTKTRLLISVGLRVVFVTRRLARRNSAASFFIEAPRFGIGDVGEPFDFGKNVGELLKVSRS